MSKPARWRSDLKQRPELGGQDGEDVLELARRDVPVEHPGDRRDRVRGLRLARHPSLSGDVLEERIDVVREALGQIGRASCRERV